MKKCQSRSLEYFMNFHKCIWSLRLFVKRGIFHKFWEEYKYLSLCSLYALVKQSLEKLRGSSPHIVTGTKITFWLTELSVCVNTMWTALKRIYKCRRLGCLLSTEIRWTSNGFNGCVSNFTHIKQLDSITHFLTSTRRSFGWYGWLYPTV